MTTYFYILLLPATLSIFFIDSKKNSKFILTILYLIFVVFVGMRHKVGMDWNNYVLRYMSIAGNTFAESLYAMTEPGYSVLNWLMSQAGYGIYGVNFVCAVIFMSGLFAYATKCKNVWTAIAVAMPYLVLVVSMSATRQSAAIGIFFLLLAFWEETSTVTKSLAIAIASMFHAAAVIMLVFVAYKSNVKNIYKIIMYIAMMVVAYYVLLLTDRYEYYQSLYIQKNIQSSGAFFHMMLNFVPAFIYILMYNKFRAIGESDGMTFTIAVSSILLTPALLISSTGADRLSLFLSAIQLKVYSALPYIQKKPSGRMLIQLCILIYAFGVMYVWLEYSNSAFAWIPYNTILSRIW